jgi:hypothetical protein
MDGSKYFIIDGGLYLEKFYGASFFYEPPIRRNLTVEVSGSIRKLLWGSIRKYQIGGTHTNI